MEAGGMKNTHPTLWRTYWLYALLSIALGANFILLRPTFDPFDIPKGAIGAAFLCCGALKMLLLLYPASATYLRASMALSVAIMSFWAGVLVLDFYVRKLTSMQLPLTYIGLAVLGVLLTMEPQTNPATEKAENGA